jgi:hypothetical protein
LSFCLSVSSSWREKEIVSNREIELVIGIGIELGIE